MSDKLNEARKIINEIDLKMAELFEKRMRAVEMVYEYKKEFGLPITDAKREEEVIGQNLSHISDDTIKEYYIDYIKNVISLSRLYQQRMENDLK